jgi:D-alanyl-D-alanine carboxypeptidase
MTVILDFLRNWLYRRRIRALHEALGIPADYGQRHDLTLQREAHRLVPVGPDLYGREQRLLAPAARAWRAMVPAAAAAGIELQLVSAYRSVAYQEGILRRKLERGKAIEDILRVSAAPGFSEHHSGRAVDLTTPGFPVLEEVFEDSEAFAWLCDYAATFGFRLSYPRGNPHGVAYEPWHWAWWGDR